jgi:hypothetical protein
MSRFVNVRTGRRRNADRHVPADRRADSPAGAAERARCFEEHFARYGVFYGLKEIELAIDFYRNTLELHQLEQAKRKAVLDADTLENYRWQVSPSIAIRAAKALGEAILKRQQLLRDCRDAALLRVEQEFGPAEMHDTAVTKSVPFIPPDLPKHEPQPSRKHRLSDAGKGLGHGANPAAVAEAALVAS